MTIITKNNEQIIRLADYGITIPLLDTRPKEVLQYLTSRIPSQVIQEDFNNHISKTDLERVHDKDWVDLIYSDDPSQAIITTFELIKPDGSYHRYDPSSATKPLKEIADEAIKDCAGTFEACQHAMETGFSYFLGGGMHHAMSHTGDGFCLLNDMVISLRKLQAKERIKTAWVIDIDAHKGDGTAQITADDTSITTLSIHMKDGWPLDNASNIPGTPNLSLIPSNIDIGIAEGEESRYLSELEKGLNQLKAINPNPDLVIIVGGSDPYEGDALPSADLLKLNLSDMLARDLLVYNFCREQKLPQAWVMSGGYGEKVWQVHAQFLEHVYKEA